MRAKCDHRGWQVGIMERLNPLMWDNLGVWIFRKAPPPNMRGMQFLNEAGVPRYVAETELDPAPAFTASANELLKGILPRVNRIIDASEKL